ncbi:putative zinc-type alcohol dehydrogenase-like protein YbdR [Staphylotrichum tortipilum]|uniref:Zinc-type alcohol dehydrogenase-like protein YbdR n=1 Tax=Staphylotrichum tortipilum TaxID=2831512 RepID=A0AAN6RNR2_9PEZI|nr:putative zinc-type alcohol dehydrogenase-like protein YbdR [Staphylotrichum longicolle]
MSNLPATMKAVVFHGPKQVAVEDRPVPKCRWLTSPYLQNGEPRFWFGLVVSMQHPRDIIVKVQATALCGSELHVFRGHQPSPTGFIMGHEFVGTVVQAGSEVKTVAIGDKVVSPFTVSCNECFYCKRGSSARCAECLLFGCPALDGGQAEYVRIPHADGTVVKAPPAIDDQALILMADIFPTGFFGARNAFQLLEPQGQAASEAVVVVIGCGPVGLCAIISALEHKPRHLFAVDSVPSRLELAKALGAEPLNFLDGKEAMLERVRAVSDGRGADAVIEVVGLSPALRTAFDLLRPFGAISSIGVHNAEIPWSGSEAYGKNLRLQMGRCPVRSIFPEALEALARNQDKFSFMFDKIMPLSEAVEGYELFDQMKVQKVIFKP